MIKMINHLNFSKPVRTSNCRSIKSKGSKGLFYHVYKLIFLLIYHLHTSDAIKVDGFSEYTGIAGSPLLLPCNTSNGASWTPHVTMVLFYKGVNGKPLFTMDRRADQRNITLPISQSPNSHFNYPRRTKSNSNRATNLISSNSFYYDQSLSTPVYFIESLRESDEGEFRCRIDYKQSRTRNYVIKLNVIVPPKENIIMNSDGQILEKRVGPIEEGDDVSLVCEAFAKPGPSVFWYFDDQLIDDSYFSEQRGLSRNELQLSHLNRSHLNSQLTCRSQNSNLTKATQTTLSIDFILKPLQVKIVVDKKHLESGQEVTFQCIVYGARPQPSISWSLVDELSSDLNNLNSVNNQDNLIENDLSSSSYFDSNWYAKDYSNDKVNFKNSSNSRNDSRTVERFKQISDVNSNFNSANSISSFQAAQKAAIYQVLSESENIHSSQIRFRLNEKFNNKHLVCRAENVRLKGTQQSSAVLQESFHLKVQYKPIVKLQLGRSLHEDRLREDSDLYLDCLTDSNPPSTSVRFLKDSQPIQPETGVLISNQTLVLQQVKRRFRGHYTCEASNNVGKSQSNDLFLRIQYAPICALNQPQTKSVPRNGQVELVCEVFADPSVTAFRWYLNNSSTSETIEITSNTAIFNQTVLKPTSPTSGSNQMSLSLNNRTNNFYKMHHYYPQPLSFTYNSSSDSNYKLNEDNTQMFISIGRFSPSNRFDFATVFCKAENQIGRQHEPCRFHLLPAGPPSKLNDCLVSNHSLTSLVVFCSNDLLNLDKYSTTSVHQPNGKKYPNSQINQQQSINSAQQYTAHHMHPSTILNIQNENTRNNHYMAIVYEAHNEQLVLNLTRKQPYFVLNTLKPATQYTVLLYAMNDQGKSPAHRLHTATLGPPEKRQMTPELNGHSSDLSYDSAIDLLTFKQSWLAAASATVAIILLAVSLIIRCTYCSRRSNSNFNVNKPEPDVVQHSQNLKLSTIKGNNLNSSTPTNNNSNSENQLLKSLKTNDIDSKETINAPNQNDFVSIEYKTTMWENESSFKRFESAGNGSIYQPTIDVIAYELDSGLGSTLNNSAFNRLNSSMKNTNQIGSSLYNTFNQLNLGHDDQILDEEQLNTHFNMPSIQKVVATSNLSSNLNTNSSNLSNISTSTASTNTTTALLPLQLHNSAGQRSLQDSQLLTADSNGFQASAATFHQQQLNSLHSNHHLTNTNSTNSSINSSTINLAANLNGLGMPSLNNLNEFYHPLEVQMFSNYANDYQLQASNGIALDNLYSPQSHQDACNLDTSLSIYQQQQIAMHLLNNNLNNNLVNNSSNQTMLANQQCSKTIQDQLANDTNLQLQR